MALDIARTGLGLGAVVNELLAGRGFGFDAVRAVFVSVLHRLFVSGSDRSCEKWMCVVADRGMISAATVAALEKRGLDYILGACEQCTKVVREVVLRDERPFVPLPLERARSEEARFDDILVLRTNATMTPLNAVLRYRELLMVEDLFHYVVCRPVTLPRHRPTTGARRSPAPRPRRRRRRSPWSRAGRDRATSGPC